MAEMELEASRKTQATDTRHMQAAVDDRGVVVKVDSIIETAVQDGAAEIHLEPHQGKLVVRTRRGGSLTPVDIEVPETMIADVINRVKVLSGMDITGTTLPQSGFFKASVDDQKIEMSCNILPTLYGEAAVVRVEHRQSATMKLEQLGMSAKMVTGFKKALSRGSGLILISGPPGAGKRTTAYASMLEVDAPDKLAIGLDPVIKYEIPGMLHGVVEEKSELAMAEAIAAVFKQEPDVAYIGDITGVDAARTVIQGACAKRIVLCRITATDGVGAVQNLVNMGVQPFLVAAALTAVTNQRLLRRLCPSCREAYTADQALQSELGVRLREGTNFYRPTGCDICGGSGYAGVHAIFELFTPSEETNRMIVAKEPVQAVRERAFQEGMAPLKMDGIGNAMHGLVSVEDVLSSL